MDKVHTSMQIRIVTLDGGCLVESMGKAATPIIAIQLFSSENGKKTSLSKESGFSQAMEPSMRAHLPIISQQEMESGTSPTEMWLLEIISKQ